MLCFSVTACSCTLQERVCSCVWLIAWWTYGEGIWSRLMMVMLCRRTGRFLAHVGKWKMRDGKNNTRMGSTFYVCMCVASTSTSLQMMLKIADVRCFNGRSQASSSGWIHQCLIGRLDRINHMCITGQPRYLLQTHCFPAHSRSSVDRSSAFSSQSTTLMETRLWWRRNFGKKRVISGAFATKDRAE